MSPPSYPTKHRQRLIELNLESLTVKKTFRNNLYTEPVNAKEIPTMKKSD